MNEVVLVPAYQREEYLALCLESIRAADPDIKVVVFCDRGWRPEISLEQYKVEVIIQAQHAWPGNSYNVLKAYAWAVSEGYQRIYLAESDVLVKPDFFRWHRAVMEKEPTCQISVGWYRECLHGNQNSYHITTNYSSIGVCWRPEFLPKVLEHLNYRFLQGQLEYLDINFPRSNYKGCGGEQDGMIGRVIEQQRWKTIYPAVARCRHIGTYGYNRGFHNSPPSSGDLLSKIAAVRELIKDRYALAEMLGSSGMKDTQDMREVGPWEPSTLQRES